MRRLISVALLLVLLLPLAAHPAAAQTCPPIPWEQTSTRSFTFVYPQGEPLGAQIAAQYGSLLDAEYNRFTRLFQISLLTPLTVRLYPTGANYACLNPLAPVIPIGQMHSHAGIREIALIAQYILADPESWQQQALDLLRHELAILFAQQLGGGKTPPGLEIGLGIYAQDPAQTFEHRLAAAPPPAEPVTSWRRLWEAPDVIANPAAPLQAASIVAYLVDVYGWERFVAFLSALRTAESYRAALAEVYQVEAGTLEAHWRVYYPLYFQGRWRINALYELSLAPYEQLIAAGAYQAASEGLAQTIALLTQRGDQPDLLAQAQALQQTAAAGLQADALARQSWQAYQEGAFAAAADFAAQALETYALLGDARNQETLAAIQSRAGEILALRADLAALQTRPPPAAAPRLLEIASRLGQLGDAEGQQAAELLIVRLNEQRQNLAIASAIAGAGFGLVFLVFYLVLVRRPPPPEALVQS